MFPVTTETTVSVSERAHLPSNMFSIPQAERCAARLRKRPPTEQMAEPWNRGVCERLRKSLGWSSWQERQEGAVGGIADKLHCTGASSEHAESGCLPSLSLCFSLLPLLPLFPSSLFSSTFLLPSFPSLCPLFSCYSPFLPSGLPSLPSSHGLCSAPSSPLLSLSFSSSLFTSLPFPPLSFSQLLPFVLPNGLP